MKKLLMIVALAGIVCTGYSKTNGTSTDAQAQKPTITISVQQHYSYPYISIHASQPVPESVSCSGQYQAEGNTTGYWNGSLSAGSTYATTNGGPSSMVQDVPISFDRVSMGGQSHNLEFESGPFETANAIYYCN